MIHWCKGGGERESVRTRAMVLNPSPNGAFCFLFLVLKAVCRWARRESIDQSRIDSIRSTFLKLKRARTVVLILVLVVEPHNLRVSVCICMWYPYARARDAPHRGQPSSIHSRPIPSNPTPPHTTPNTQKHTPTHTHTHTGASAAASPPRCGPATPPG